MRTCLLCRECFSILLITGEINPAIIVYKFCIFLSRSRCTQIAYKKPETKHIKKIHVLYNEKVLKGGRGTLLPKLILKPKNSKKPKNHSSPIEVFHMKKNSKLNVKEGGFAGKASPSPFPLINVHEAYLTELMLFWDSVSSDWVVWPQTSTYIWDTFQSLGAENEHV